MDIPPSIVSQLADLTVNIGNVYRIKMDESNGITPKAPGDISRNKFFIVLGVDIDDNVYGGVIINSEINPNINSNLREFHIPIQRIHYSFLVRDSYVDCSDIKVVSKSSFAKWQFLGRLDDYDIEIVNTTILSCPAINKATKKRFGII